MSVVGQVGTLQRAEAPLAGADRQSARKTTPASTPWRVFLTCWLTYTVFWTPYIVREHFPAFTLSERGTLNVDQYLGWSDDIFQGPRGGAYINNNPGAPLAGAVALVLLRPMLEKIERWNERRAPAPMSRESDPIWMRAVAARREFYFLVAGFITVALVMATATAGTMAYLCGRLRNAGMTANYAGIVSLLCGLATPLLYRAAYLNHNLLAADAGFLALLLVWDPKGGPLTTLRAALAGLLAGYALLCDYSGVVVIAVVGTYVFLRRPASVAAFTLGVAPLAAALLIYQTWAFGSFYRPSQHFMTPTAPTSHGYRGFDWPSARLLWANFFDPRFGLFAYCPALLLAFAAPFVARGSFRVPRLETWILFAYFGLFVLFCACNQYSWLQPSTGFRYLVPVVPALALLAMQTCQIFPAAVKWTIALTALAQSFILSAAHENNFALSVRTLWLRKFELPWMIRLSDLGLSAPWAAPAAALGLLAAALIWVPYKRGDWRR
jgi:hypothetical protein